MVGDCKPLSEWFSRGILILRPLTALQTEEAVKLFSAAC